MADILSGAGIDPQTMQSLGIAPQQPTGVLGQVGAFLAHPAVQGALASYLGAISSPRRMGWGGAIGRGGLAGLNAFGQAEKLEEQLPFERAKAIGEIAKIPEEQAHTEYLTAQTGLAKGKAAAYAPDQADANQWALLAQQATDPTERGMLSTFSNGRAKGSMTQSEAIMRWNAFRQGNARVALEGLQGEEAKQKTALASEQTNLLPGEVAARENASNASAALSGARIGEVAPTINKMNAEATLAQDRAKQLNQPGGGKYYNVRTYNAADPTKTAVVPVPVGTPYNPPAGTVVGIPPHPPKPADPTAEADKGLSNLAKLHTAFGAERGLTGRAYDALTGTSDAKFGDYATERGIDPKTGMATSATPAAPAITLPPEITTTSAALKYLIDHGMPQDKAIEWLRNNHAAH